MILLFAPCEQAFLSFQPIQLTLDLLVSSGDSAHSSEFHIRSFACLSLLRQDSELSMALMSMRCHRHEDHREHAEDKRLDDANEKLEKNYSRLDKYRDQGAQNK
jgi:hypothetical protein